MPNNNCEALCRGYQVAADLIAFITLGKWLEARAKVGAVAPLRDSIRHGAHIFSDGGQGATSRVLHKLLELKPETAILLSVNAEGRVVEERVIPAEQLQVGDMLKVRRASSVLLQGFCAHRRRLLHQPDTLHRITTTTSNPASQQMSFLGVGGRSAREAEITAAIGSSQGAGHASSSAGCQTGKIRDPWKQCPVVFTDMGQRLLLSLSSRRVMNT